MPSASNSTAAVSDPAAAVSDTAPMALAIAASAAALEAGDMPFGATLVSPAGEVLLVARNNQVSTQDCTGHAELVLVRQAAGSLGPDSLRGATVYASGEPCAMCCGAMFWAGIGRVVYAASTADIAQALGGPLLPLDSRSVLAGASPAVEVQGPVMGAEAIAVLQRFASTPR
ncbi:nucleoside deaminase [Rhodoferax lacus]|uniref:Nucleoside deaminase n=1 Tax=Rhodoferax lacus TaxID=2184758 RepID=A0A3E1RAX5_9BURK|nr:nucleoside deaminase [Rhodoferax lacus]RFO96508.1 nucleoside deaminase [Rhodoferax lacus]